MRGVLNSITENASSRLLLPDRWSAVSALIFSLLLRFLAQSFCFWYTQKHSFAVWPYGFSLRLFCRCHPWNVLHFSFSNMHRETAIIDIPLLRVLYIDALHGRKYYWSMLFLIFLQVRYYLSKTFFSLCRGGRRQKSMTIVPFNICRSLISRTLNGCHNKTFSYLISILLCSSFEQLILKNTFSR